MNRLFSPRTILLFLVSSCLGACVSYEPAVLVPAVTLSAEEISLVSDSNNTLQVDFGLDTAANESDSLFNLETLPGVRVVSVTSNGPAEAAGIQVGDVVLAVNGTETNNPDALLALQGDNSGQEQTYRFTVQRNTTVFEASVIARPVANNPAPVELYRVDPLATRAGYESALVDIGDDGPMVAARVVQIFPSSPLPGAGIQVGELILAVDGEFLNSAQDLVTRLNQEYPLGSEVTMTRFDGQQVSDLRVRLWDPGRRISRIALGPLFRYESSLSPASESLTILDFWLFSLYSYQQAEGERSHSLLGLINVTSDSGELIEETNN